MKIEPQTVKAIKDESVSIPHEYPWGIYITNLNKNHILKTHAL